MTALPRRWADKARKVAEELIKNNPLTVGATVSIDSKMPIRKVTVTKHGDTIFEFEQGKDDLRGQFCANYSRLEFNND